MIEINLLPGKKRAVKGAGMKLSLPDFRGLIAQVKDPWLITAIIAWVIVGGGGAALFITERARLAAAEARLENIRTEKRRYVIVVHRGDPGELADGHRSGSPGDGIQRHGPLPHRGLGLYPHRAARAGGEVAMALGLPTDQRGQIMALLALVALAGGYFFWTQVHKPTIEKIGAARSEADSLERIVAAAKADLASGSIEDLRRRVEEYQGSLELMRRLVPDRNEVPTLIDDISTKAKVRGVTLGKIQPLAPEPGSPFDTYRYRLEVYGHYDQIGEYLADVASLPRIVVPQDVTLSTATPAVQKLLGDTAGSLLLAEFQIRTFVKAAGPPPPPAGKPAGAPRARS